ncbi:MAG: biotin/lipoyl-binding protein [Terrimicrobiaceae bacterium]
MKKLRVTVNGKSYDVTVEDLESTASPTQAASPVPARVASSVAPPAPSQAAPQAPPPAASAGDVLSPLAGRVVAVNCSVGATVETGATLITLEAMKMNTFVSAASAGTVKAIYVKEGDAVEEGQALVSMA